MIGYLFAGIPVADLDLAAAWYERFTGREADLVPNDREMAWRMSETGWICLIRDAERAGGAMHTVLVDDLDAFVAGLGERGITSGPVEDLGGGARHSVATDPDGNRLSIGQP